MKGNDMTYQEQVDIACVATGFSKCDEGGRCDQCNAEVDMLYSRNDNYWDCREGDYWCDVCVVELHDANERDYAEAMAKGVT